MAKGKGPKGVRPTKFTLTSRKITGKNVVVKADGEPEAAVARLSITVKGRRVDRYLSSTDTLPLKVHRAKGQAVSRATRKFPIISPRLRKKL